MATFFGWKHANDYAVMLSQVIYFFLLLGILVTVLGSELDSFADTLISNNALSRFFALTLYLAILPVFFELVYWIYVDDQAQRELFDESDGDE